MSANNDSFSKTLIVAVSLCLVCSLAVSGAAILLRKEQQINKIADIRKSILLASGLTKAGESVDVNAIFAEKIEARVVDLASGQFVDDINIEKFDQRREAKNPKNNKVLSKKEDIASIKRRAKQAKVYLVKENGQIKSIILPIHGYGLFSTLYGFLAIQADTQTVVGLKFYEQSETPGLGGEVENPNWIAQWPGRQVLNDQFKPVLKLVKTGASNKTEVDALSGATMTSQGIERLLTYWLGDDGFGPFLANIRKDQRG